VVLRSETFETRGRLSLVFFASLAMFGCGDESTSKVVELPVPDAGMTSVDGAATGSDAHLDSMVLAVDMAVPKDPYEVTWSGLIDRGCPDHSILTYENFGQAFMLTWCVSCHSSVLPAGERAGAPVGIDLDSLDAVRRLADRIWSRSADDNQTMPPLGGIDQETRFRLGEWLGCGTPP
jgi:hypothetical protein